MSILPFTSPAVSLSTSGGKGANLARLALAGFPVPPGFIITTHAYRAFISINELQATISASLDAVNLDDPPSLEAASELIRSAFSTGGIPAEIETTILAAYHDLSNASSSGGEKWVPVAVRSSATAEDLPDLSFAGQQDTFLNVIGDDQLLTAVINCWSSLWTGRAIGYRLRNAIGSDDVSLAVIVQQMAAAEVSGVLFTANPLTGLRSETVIDATFGLGEALVSGQVQPDHYVVNSQDSEILEKTLGGKAVSTRPRTGGGVDLVAEEAASRQALTDAGILELAALGKQIEAEYGAPQDIEWALAEAVFSILQSRPVTSLFPLPYERSQPLDIWFFFGAVQGMLGAMTPLGQDTLRVVIGGLARLFGGGPRFDNQAVFAVAGERIWVKISDLLRHPIGKRGYKFILEFVEPSVGQILDGLVADQRLGFGAGKFKFSTLRRLLGFFLPILTRLVVAMRHPERERAAFDAFIESEIVYPTITGSDPFTRLQQRLQFMAERTSNVFYRLLPRFIPVFGASMGALNLLNKLADGEAESGQSFSPLVMEVTRGLPNNVTTEMDLALWAAAVSIKSDPISQELFQTQDAEHLAESYLAGLLSPVAQDALASFMESYGMRGIGEIDMGQPLWRERPATIIQTLQSYLLIPPDQAPDILFKRGAQSAEEAIEKLTSAARNERGGRLKEKIVRFAARRVRVLMGVREAPKFYAVRMMGIVRAELLASGRDFVDLGMIDQPDDLFFLHISELEELSRSEWHSDPTQPDYQSGLPEISQEWHSDQNQPDYQSGLREVSPELHSDRDLKALIAERRAVYARENRRLQVPRVLVSDGRAFYEGVGAAIDSGQMITGSPVSPGVVEGTVHVVLDPLKTHLAPGDILVCHGTDPAWTPLFLAAGGLITEVGGMMTHGSVVAREYGIPAVVGVHQATSRLKDGQRVRLDGSSGKIALLS